MQALSFAVHIPLVCFGIAFPALVLFVEWLYLRTGDELYRTLARRWSKVMVALFAAGVVTGTILSFELGILWPGFMARFGNVFGLGFAIEGFSFFLEAIFIGIYIYGWDRLSPRAALAGGIPIAIAGFTGSLTVISVNGWMNHPTGFQHRRRQGRRRASRSGALRQQLLLARARAHVPGRLHGHRLPRRRASTRWGWLRGRWGRYERTALAIPLAVAALAAPVQVLVGDWTGARRRAGTSRPSSLPSKGSARPDGARRCTCSAGTGMAGVEYGIPIPRLLSLLAYHDPNATVVGLDAVPPDERPPVNVVRIAFQTMVGIGTLLAAARRCCCSYAGGDGAGCRSRRWFYRALVLAGPLSVVALIAGWVTTEVGRQPWVVYRVMRTRGRGHRRRRHPGRLRDARARLRSGSRSRSAWMLRRLAPRDPSPEHARS